jgi:hypothetical protein
MENKFLPLGYADMLERMKYKDMLERMSSTTDPQYSDTEQFASPVERGPTQKFGDLIGKGLYKLPHVFEDERSAMRSGQDVANVLAFAPGTGNVLGYLEGQKMSEEGRPFLGSLISSASVGFPGAAKGAGSITTPPVKTAPTPKGLEHKTLHTADRPKEIKDIQKWNAGQKEETKYRSSANLMPLRYSDNNTQMTSQLALFESDLYKLKNRNKPYPIENILQAMRRYGTTGKGNVNQNVARQIEDFISPELIAKGKVSPAEVMEELQKNAPKIEETHAYYNLASMMDDNTYGFYNNSNYAPFTTRRPLYDLDSPTTTVVDSQHQTSRSYGERRFNMYDDGRIYGKKPTGEESSPKVSFDNRNHSDLALGYKLGSTESPTANSYMHQRYTFETIDGQDNVLVGQEFQSDPYTFTKDQNKIAQRLDTSAENPALDVPYMFQHGEYDGILAGIVSGKRRTTEMIREELPKFHDYLVGTNKAKAFDQELGDHYKSLRSDLNQAELETGFNRITGKNYGQYNEIKIELEDTFRQQTQRMVENYVEGFHEYLGLSGGLTPKNLPRSADWFTDNLKLLLQTGAKSDSPFVLVPKGSRSVAPPSGNTRVIPPKMIPFLEKQYKNNKNVKLNYNTKGELINVQKWDGYPSSGPRYSTELEAKPNLKDVNRAKNYDDFLKKGLKQTEQDYGIKLKPTEYIDQYDQEYLKIELTPELKSAFQTFRMKHGGAASILPLKYGL